MNSYTLVYDITFPHLTISRYRKSDGGWKAKAKKKEMTQETSRYLIAFCDGKPTAFSHFQFDMDYGREVLYWLVLPFVYVFLVAQDKFSIHFFI